MQTSSAGLHFTESWEGKEKKGPDGLYYPYLDCVKVWTIYVGHRVLDGEIFTSGITDEMGELILSKDIRHVEMAVGNSFPQHIFDALVDFGFNCGVGAIQTSSAVRLLKEGKITAGAEALKLWCKAGGKFNQGLYNRRVAEAQMILQGEKQAATHNAENMARHVEPFEPWELENIMNSISAGLRLSYEPRVHGHD